jgi:nucleoside 2-deoxyribosyltransferase
MKKVYLAVPYSHENPDVRFKRFERSCRATAYLMSEGYIVFSPITHSHPVAAHLNNHLSYEFWLEQDAPFLDWADEICILKIDGYKESKGVNWEKKYMEGLDKLVWFLDWEDVLKKELMKV